MSNFVYMHHRPEPSPISVYGNEFQKQSYDVLMWLRNHPQDIVHFHALGGLGYYSLMAKAQGLFSSATTLVVGVHAIPGSEMNNIDRGVTALSQSPNKLEHVQDYMQQRSAELAVCFLSIYLLSTYLRVSKLFAALDLLANN
jgi:hypothetical protein